LRIVQNNKVPGAMDSSLMPKKADSVQVSESASGSASSARTINIANNRIESRDLFVATKEITIGHEGEVYRLRLTALNKLILTK
jgi:hemin uptake protein HemP